MSWRDAPLYIETHDLAVWTIPHAEAWTHRHLGRRVSQHAGTLVCAVSLALTFPATRQWHLRQADENIVKLRTELRLATGLGLISDRQLRFASRRLRVIGRMVGGWRKRLRAPRQASTIGSEGQPKELQSAISGSGPPAATA